MQFDAFTRIVIVVAVAVSYGECAGRPVQLSMARIEQAQGTAEIMKAAKARENIIALQRTIATATDSSNTLQERQLSHQEDSVGHADRMISDMQQMMADERELRMASQAHASQIQQALKSATDDEAHLSSDLTEAQKALSQRALQLTDTSTALARADLDEGSLHKKLEAVMAADANKDAIIAKDDNLLLDKGKEEKTNLGLLQKKLQEQGIQDELHVKAEKEEKATIDQLTSKNEGLLVNVDELNVEVSKETQAAQNSEENALSERKLVEETKEALAKTTAQIAPTEAVKKQLEVLTQANKKLQAKYDTQVAAGLHAKGLEEQEEKILDSTQDTLKETTLKLQDESKAKKEEDFQLQQATLEMQRHRAELESQAEKMAALQQRLKDTQAKNSAMKKTVDDTAVVAHHLSEKSKEIRAKLTELKISGKEQKEQLEAVHSKMTKQLQEDDEKEEAQRAADLKKEEALKKENAEVQLKLDDAKEEKQEILAKGENLQREATAKNLKLQAAVAQAQLRGTTEAERLKAIIAGQDKKTLALEADKSKQTLMLKAASEENSKLASSIPKKNATLQYEEDLRAKEIAAGLAAAAKELSASRLQGDVLVQKLKKVSTALVKEHKQRLDDWNVFKTKLEDDSNPLDAASEETKKLIDAEKTKAASEESAKLAPRVDLHAKDIAAAAKDNSSPEDLA